MPRKECPIGQVFAYLKVLSEAPPRTFPSGQTHRFSLCLCLKCGTTFEARTSGLGKNTKSCGCIRIIHGMRKTRTYKQWVNMKQRCTNPNNIGFDNYMGKGITVCPEWNNPDSFPRFYADMGECPPGLTLGRIDHAKGYSKDNCQWETITEQNRKTSRNTYFTVLGIHGCVAELAAHFGVNVDAVLHRIYELKWDITRAFTQTVRAKKTSHE